MPMTYKVRKSSIRLLPRGCRDIHILHVSDLHLTPSNKRLIADIKSFINLKPDLVIVTGDFLAHKDAINPLIAALDELLDLPGLFVFGSNDYYGPRFKNPLLYLRKDTGGQKLGKKLPWQRLQKHLIQRGWKDLNNKKVEIKVNGVVIRACGTDDAHINLDDYKNIVGTGIFDISIGITHAPYGRVLNAMSKDQTNLIFAGHTHGGQVRLPWFGGSRSLTTNCDLPNWRSRGLTKLPNEPFLNVSAGMGVNPFMPFRIFCSREVSFIKLTQ